MIRETILKLITDNGTTSPREIADFGFNYRVVAREFRKLVDEGVIESQGSTRACSYRMVVPGSPVDNSITLPDLPDVILFWMGYTNRRPAGAYKVQGIMSRGSE